MEDWLWSNSSTPANQVYAFASDVNQGGNLVTMHYHSPSTVSYLRDLIHFVQLAGMKIMRIDQCLEDPDSPPLVVN